MLSEAHLEAQPLGQPLAVEAEIAHAYAIAGRDLTPAEWPQYLPEQPYHPTGEQ